MRQILLVAFVAVLTSAAVASAEDPKPAQPPAAAPKVAPAIQPAQPRLIAVWPARMLQLEEDVEVLEAQREVRRAYLRAAEVSVAATKERYELTAKGVGLAVSAPELAAAKYEFETAKAQAEIRTAELKEVEVKLKFAKKRLEDAKAGGAKPAPAP